MKGIAPREGWDTRSLDKALQELIADSIDIFLSEGIEVSLTYDWEEGKAVDDQLYIRCTVDEDGTEIARKPLLEAIAEEVEFSCEMMLPDFTDDQRNDLRRLRTLAEKISEIADGFERRIVAAEEAHQKQKAPKKPKKK